MRPAVKSPFVNRFVPCYLAVFKLISNVFAALYEKRIYSQRRLTLPFKNESIMRGGGGV